jgi:hypothetical protein
MHSRHLLRTSLADVIIFVFAVIVDAHQQLVCDIPLPEFEEHAHALLQARRSETSLRAKNEGVVWTPDAKTVSWRAIEDAGLSKLLQSGPGNDGVLHQVANDSVMNSHASARKFIDDDVDDVTQLFAGLETAGTSITGMLRKARARGSLDLIDIGLFILAPLLIAALALCVRQNSGISDAAGRVIPLASACSLCAALSMATASWGSPWVHFSPTTALITVVFVMDLGTVERFVIKITLRGLGTFLGGVMAVGAAEFSELFGHHLIMQASFVFTVLSFDMLLAFLFHYMAYTFTMTTVTFALVFFGYIQRGWTAVWERFFSVLIGELLAIICNVFFLTIFSDIRDARAVIVIIKKSEQLFSRAFVALDFAFIRNSILAATSDEAVLQLRDVGYLDEVSSWFRLEDDEAAEMETQAKAAEVRQLARATIFHDLPMDISVSVLQAECRQCWQDMMFVRSLFNHRICGGWRFFDKPLQFCSLPDRVHPVVLQASSLAHAGALDAEMWKQNAQSLDQIRLEIQGLRQHFEVFFKYLENIHKVGHGLDEDNVEVLIALRASVKTLTDAQAMLTSFWTPTGSCIAKDFSALSIITSTEKSDAFCQGLNLILMDFCLFLLCCLYLMRFDHTKAEDMKSMIETLADMACVNIADLEEQMEAPMDISSSAVVRNWRRRASHAARAIGIGGLHHLLPGTRSRRSSGSQPGSNQTSLQASHALAEQSHSEEDVSHPSDDSSSLDATKEGSFHPQTSGSFMDV